MFSVDNIKPIEYTVHRFVKNHSQPNPITMQNLQEVYAKYPHLREYTHYLYTVQDCGKVKSWILEVWSNEEVQWDVKQFDPGVPSMSSAYALSFAKQFESKTWQRVCTDEIDIKLLTWEYTFDEYEQVVEQETDTL